MRSVAGAPALIQFEGEGKLPRVDRFARFGETWLITPALQSYTRQPFSSIAGRSVPIIQYINRAFSYDVTAAILVCQANPVGVEILSYVNTSFCSNRFT